MCPRCRTVRWGKGPWTARASSAIPLVPPDTLRPSPHPRRGRRPHNRRRPLAFRLARLRARRALGSKWHLLRMFTTRFLASISRAAIPAMGVISVWVRPFSARNNGTIPGGIGKNTSGKPTINPRASVASVWVGKFPGKLRGRKAPNGAGVLLTTGKKVLVLLRSDEVTEPGTWNLAGGGRSRVVNRRHDARIWTDGRTTQLHVWTHLR